MNSSQRTWKSALSRTLLTLPLPFGRILRIDVLTPLPRRHARTAMTSEGDWECPDCGEAPWQPCQAAPRPSLPSRP